MIHSKFGIGIVVGCDVDKVSIEFPQKKAIFSIDFMLKNMKILNPTEEIFDSNHGIDDNQQKIDVSEGDILKLPSLGRVRVKAINAEYLMLENIEHQSFKYLFLMVKLIKISI